MAKKTKTPSPAAEGMPSPKKLDGGPDDWDAESAYRDLLRAEEHHANPELMERVKKHAGRKHKALTGLHSKLLMGEEKKKDEIKSIDDIRKAASKKAVTGKRAM